VSERVDTSAGECDSIASRYTSSERKEIDRIRKGKKPNEQSERTCVMCNVCM
jgi:hypothetical protein